MTVKHGFYRLADHTFRRSDFKVLMVFYMKISIRDRIFHLKNPIFRNTDVRTFRVKNA